MGERIWANNFFHRQKCRRIPFLMAVDIFGDWKTAYTAINKSVRKTILRHFFSVKFTQNITFKKSNALVFFLWKKKDAEITMFVLHYQITTFDGHFWLWSSRFAVKNRAFWQCFTKLFAVLNFWYIFKENSLGHTFVVIWNKK